MKSYIVDTAAIRGNLKNLKKRAGKAVFWAVLKGNGYGLGLVPMAQLCAEEGIDHFAVTEASDVRTLREAGFTGAAILVLRPVCEPAELAELLELGAILTISSQEDATVLSGLAAEKGVTPEAHIKIDTGMGRYGFLPSERDKVLSLYQYMKVINFTGMYTHFHSAFCSKNACEEQILAFQSLVRALREAGCDVGMLHVCNSEGLLRLPEFTMDGVRIGSAILGRVRGKFGLKRVGYCEATVEELRWFPTGHTCGYGAGWKAKKPTRAAVFSVGWYHGFGCEMGNDLFRARDCLRGIWRNLKGLIIKRSITVTVNGKKCKVLGHIGMLHTVVDVSKISCAVGDTAVFDINPIMLKGMDVVFR